MKTEKPLLLDHLNLTVNSFEETAEWYSETFGFKVVESGVRFGVKWGVLRAGEVLLCVYEHPELAPPSEFAGPGDEGAHRINHFGIRITDREGWLKTLKERNLKTYFNSPVEYPHSTSWYVRDPTGHEIEVALWDENSVRF